MSLFTRLFLLLAILCGVSLGAVAVLLWNSSGKLEQNLHERNIAVGNAVRNKGTDLVEASIRTTHVKIVSEKARKLEAFFAEIARAARLETSLALQFLSDDAATQSAPPLYTGQEVVRRKEEDARFRADEFDKAPYAMFNLAPGVKLTDVQDRMNRLRRLGGFFAHTRRTLAGCVSPYLGDQSGFIFGYPGGTPFNATYDHRLRPWFQDAIQRRRMTWVLYVDKNQESLVVTCANPISAAPGEEPFAVAAIDVRLQDILTELFTVSDLKVSNAILLDEQDRVRVSARYDKNSITFDKDLLLRTPPVNQLGEPGFTRALESIHQDPTTYSGLLWDKGTDASPGNVFIYSAVEFKDLADYVPGPPRGMANPAKSWHYIVQLPIASLNQPVRDVTGELDRATGDISSAIKREVHESAMAVGTVMIVTLLAALLCAYLGARNTSKPIMEIADVARGIGAGNLEQRVEVTSSDEIGQLGGAINGMIDGLKQRNLLKDTFGRYVAPGVVDKVLADGNVRLGGLKRTATVFFSDIKGFTTIAENTAPETLVPQLNEYFNAMTRIILATEGTLDKYIGDAILAFWGDPVAHEDDALRACRAALEQRRELQNLWASWAARKLPRLDIRIGIETGQVIVGNVGSELKLNYTILGDTVNFASRLESANKLYGTHILIGQITREQAGDAIEVRELDLLTVSGKQRPVRVYELLGLAGEVPQQCLAGYREYEAALRAYRLRKWDEAISHLTRAQAALGEDAPSQALLERIEDHRQNPPHHDWNGAYIALAK